MLIRNLHSWNITPSEAIEIQKSLRRLVVSNPSIRPETITMVAGCDAAYSRRGDRVFASVALLSYPRLQLIEEASVECNVCFPYVPGLLVFREGPSVIRALERLSKDPDVVIFDGQGMAHPRGIGMASHLGILLDRPTIGVAKTVLCGRYEEPAEKKGASSALFRKGKEVGRVLRTRDAAKPVFVSVGHKIDVSTAEEIVLGCCAKYRLPEPLRRAHILANKLRGSAAGCSGQ